MGNLIFSRTPNIKRPYYFQELGVHLYSAEELCFVIYHYVDLIDESFVDERLLDFIHQLDQPRLEERVLRMREQGGLYDVLYVVLQELRYYSSSDLFGFRKQLESLSRLSRAERLKRKSRLLFERGQYYGALRALNQVLELDSRELTDSAFVSGIWQMKAACYARTEHFSEALENLKNAWLLTRDPALWERIYVLNRMQGRDEMPDYAEGLVSPEQLEQFRSNLEKRRNLAAYRGKALEAAALEEKEEPERTEAFLELLFRWKEEYRKRQLS
ncbi:MAG: hypothetical protein J6H18_05655 [Lachnospiraceae bacterium]|nr:hypothetical protein [Lachnospiraceae bacterium]